MVKPRIAIIGAGQIGSRHLQALALVDRAISIQVVDTNTESLSCAKERYSQIVGKNNSDNVEYFTKISELSPELDIAIVATSADIRRKIIEELLSNCNVRYMILEKIVFQNPSDFSVVNALFERKNVQAWVNCPRRMWPFYNELQKILRDSNSIEFSVSGSGRGLIGCNGIHFLDLFCYLTAQTEVVLCSDLLDRQIVESQRLGFIEFSGTLSGVSSVRKRFFLTSFTTGNAPLLIVINSEKVRCLICEEQGTAWIAESIKNWEWREVIFTTPYQSQLTHFAVQEILDHGKCKLSDYSESWALHDPLLKALMDHLAQLIGEEVCLCPIT